MKIILLYTLSSNFLQEIEVNLEDDTGQCFYNVRESVH